LTWNRLQTPLEVTVPITYTSTMALHALNTSLTTVPITEAPTVAIHILLFAFTAFVAFPLATAALCPLHWAS
jgi:hypothetical protein